MSCNNTHSLTGALDEVGAPVVTIDPKTGRARPLAVPMVVNAVLAGASTWRMVLQVVRDLHPLFDAINVSTALHRLARFARSQVCWCGWLIGLLTAVTIVWSWSTLG